MLPLPALLSSPETPREPEDDPPKEGDRGSTESQEEPEHPLPGVDPK